MRVPMDKVRWLRRVALLVVAIGPIGCGQRVVDPSKAGDFPSVPTSGNLGCPSTAPTIYMIIGLSSRVIDPTAPSLVAQMSSGEEASLGVTGYECGSYGDTRWTSTKTDVATITPGVFTFSARLVAAAPGETQIFADFVADNGNRYRTTLAYCTGVLPGEGCANPRKIEVVRVVPR
jgi:hypothetical protein